MTPPRRLPWRAPLALAPLLLAVFACGAGAVNPGLNFYITSSAIMKAVNHILPTVVADIKNITIPGNKGSHYSYDPIKFSSVAVQQFQLSYQGPNHVLVHIVGLTLGVAHTHFDLFDKIGPIKVTCGGEFWGEAANTNIFLNTTVVDSNGHPQLPDIINGEQFGKLSVDHKLDGACKIIDWLADLFVDINKVIEKVIEEDVPKLISGRVKDLTNAALMKLSMTAKIDQYAQLVYDLTSNPEVDGTSLGLHLQGEFLPLTNPKPWPLTPPPLPTPQLGRDIEIQVSDYVFNTAALTFTEQGVLDIRNAPIPANTTVFEKIIPAIYNKCPGCPMTIDYGIVSPPVATFAPNDASIQISTSALNLTAVEKNGTRWQLFDVGVTATIDSKLSIVNDILKINLGLPHFQLKMINSFVGPFNVTLISDLVDTILTKVIIPDFDSKFPGIPLPTTGNVVLDNPTLTMLSHSAVIATDFHYKS